MTYDEIYKAVLVALKSIGEDRHKLSWLWKNHAIRKTKP